MKGEKRTEAKDEKEAAHRAERVYGRFERAIHLPCRVAPGAAEATFKNGVLTVVLPKAAEAQRRRVPIRSDSPPLRSPHFSSCRGLPPH